MIRRLHLTNFRRHADSEILIDSTQQVIAITGNNGAGKTALLEAIVFCLYGESRHGPRRVDSLVRHGAELEGMQTELDFVRDGVDYRVQRRRDNKAVSAVLYANGVATVTGHRAVTAEVTRLFGMDAAGFKAAVVAQQKELDALLRLGGAARSKTVSRLLRLDAVTRAKDDARSRWKTTLVSARSLPDDDTDGDRQRELLHVEAQLADARAAESACRAEVAELEHQLDLTVDVSSAYFARRAQLATITSQLDTLNQRRSHLQAERDSVDVPVVDDSDDDIDALRHRQHHLDLEIAAAHERQQAIRQRQLIVTELERARQRLDELDREPLSVAPLEAELIVIDERLRDLDGDEQQRSSQREQLREHHSDLRSRITQARDRLDAWATLGSECDRCHQPIPHEHAHDHQQRLHGQLDTWTAELDDVTAAGKQLTAELAEIVRHRHELLERRADILRQLDVAAREEGERSELRRRIGAWEDVHTSEPIPDLDHLYHQRGDVEVALKTAEHRHQLLDIRRQAVDRIAELERELAAVDTDIARCETERAAWEHDDVDVRFEQRQQLEQRWRDELELLNGLAEQTATLREQHATARQRLQQQQQLAELRNRYLHDGTVAATALELLDTVEKNLSVTIRPAMESLVSDLLATMSNQRFTTVRFGPDYLPSVDDRGTFRPLYELSGGEQDLVALAFRLALAQLVAERHGGGVGFLVLDEIFGSQDRERRDAILTGLRGLRRVFNQIWCISHVGGLEDAADLVIDVELDDDGVATLA